MKKEVNLLFVTHQFPESGGRRQEKLVKYFPRFGIRPVVLTSSLLDPLASEVLQHEFPPDLAITRVSGLPNDPFKLLTNYLGMVRFGDWLRRGIFFPDFWVHWLPLAARRALPIIRREKIDAIFTTSPPESLHLLGLYLQRRTGLPWFADFRDLWTEKKINYRPPTLLHHRLALNRERAVFRKSTAVIANTPYNYRIYRERFHVPAERMTVITNGFDPQDNPVPHIAPQTDARKLVFGYLGYLDKPGFPWREILRIFQELRQAGIPVELRVIGYISRRALAQMEAEGYRRFVHYLPQMPNYRAVPELARQSDLLLTLLYETDYSAAIVPLKMYSYLLMNRRILAVAPETGEVNRILRETRLGESISIGQKERIKEFIRRAYREKRRNGRVAVRPDRAHVEKFNILRLTERLSVFLLKKMEAYEKN